MRALEALLFLSLATGLHAAVWHVALVPSGVTTSGGSGRDDVTIQAASASQLAMVAAWQRPPETSMQTPQMTTTAPSPAVLIAPTSLMQPGAPQMVAPPRLAALPDPMSAPHIYTSPAARPPTPQAPVTAQRPRPRPMRDAQLADTAPMPENRPERRAAGGAQQAQKGTSGAASAQAENAQRTNALRAQWGSRIHSKVQRNMRYPSATTSTGTTKLGLSVTPSGHLQTLRLLRSSGDKKLDQAALRAVKRAGRFAKAPNGLSDAAYAFSLSLTFTR